MNARSVLRVFALGMASEKTNDEQVTRDSSRLNLFSEVVFLHSEAAPAAAIGVWAPVFSYTLPNGCNRRNSHERPSNDY